MPAAAHGPQVEMLAITVGGFGHALGQQVFDQTPVRLILNGLFVRPNGAFVKIVYSFRLGGNQRKQNQLLVGRNHGGDRHDLDTVAL